MTMPKPGDALPKRNTPLFTTLARFAFTRFGWRVEGRLPHLPRFVAVARRTPLRGTFFWL